MISLNTGFCRVKISQRSLVPLKFSSVYVCVKWIPRGFKMSEELPLPHEQALVGFSMCSISHYFSATGNEAMNNCLNRLFHSKKNTLQDVLKMTCYLWRDRRGREDYQEISILRCLGMTNVGLVLKAHLEVTDSPYITTAVSAWWRSSRCYKEG